MLENAMMMSIIYILVIILLVVLIIIGIRFISVIDNLNDSLNDVNHKLHTLDWIFDTIDHISCSISSLNRKITTKAQSIMRFLPSFGKNKNTNGLIRIKIRDALF